MRTLVKLVKALLGLLLKLAAAVVILGEPITEGAWLLKVSLLAGCLYYIYKKGGFTSYDDEPVTTE